MDLRKASWNSLPTLKTVRLEGGRRYPIQVSTEARILTGRPPVPIGAALQAALRRPLPQESST